VEGTVMKVAREEAEAYFHSRPQASQLGTWASAQSSVIAGRKVLEDAFKAMEKKFAGQPVPLPPHWGGWRLAPETVEFWQGRRSRLHDRLRYRRSADGWTVERLAPWAGQKIVARPLWRRSPSRRRCSRRRCARRARACSSRIGGRARKGCRFCLSTTASA